jgi:hypothetical protein
VHSRNLFDNFETIRWKCGRGQALRLEVSTNNFEQLSLASGKLLAIRDGIILRSSPRQTVCFSRWLPTTRIMILSAQRQLLPISLVIHTLLASISLKLSIPIQRPVTVWQPTPTIIPFHRPCRAPQAAATQLQGHT